MNEWATECATHIFQRKNRNSRTLKICPAPSTWMDGVYRVVRWVMRGFDAADSERTVRRESPTCPMLTSNLPRKQNRCTQCTREDCDSRHIPSDESETFYKPFSRLQGTSRLCLHVRKGHMPNLATRRHDNVSRASPSLTMRQQRHLGDTTDVMYLLTEVTSPDLR